ncbi:hypothetical protein D9V84_03420 [Bacteroidetes/Chlorobi group bacterium Naka2016]|jgi:hypothetical protein|nr:MAG: hypothetical protein D9V84_03420 [Bacteroidetes/Chlorobi group bacterium Naka2016]
METLNVNLSQNPIRSKNVNRIISFVVLIFFAVAAKIFVDAFKNLGSSLSYVLIIFGILLVITIGIFIFVTSKVQSSVLDSIEIQPEQITFFHSKGKITVSKNSLDAIIIERLQLGDIEQTQFHFRIKSKVLNLCKNFLSDDHLSYTNKDLNDTPQGSQVYYHIDFYKRYYSDFLLLKNI